MLRPHNILVPRKQFIHRRTCASARVCFPAVHFTNRTRLQYWALRVRLLDDLNVSLEVAHDSDYQCKIRKSNPDCKNHNNPTASVSRGSHTDDSDELTLKQLIEKSLQVLVSASFGASVMRKSGPKLSKRGQKQSRGSLGVFIHK